MRSWFGWRHRTRDGKKVVQFIVYISDAQKGYRVVAEGPTRAAVERDVVDKIEASR